MNIKTWIKYEESYLPPRCRKMRYSEREEYPELVTRKPTEEHGNGDEFINSLEQIINNSDTATEAGLLCIAMTAALSA